MLSAHGVVRIPRAIDERLARLSARTGRAKSFYARKALESYLEEMEDRLMALAAIEESKGKETVSIDAVIKKLGLDGKV